ncbi:M1 family metallopeptidase [Crocinitomix catalasitica]|uniref:M1 family metallopeptidase n=1 Tax=Crocinitomix catalasitica TaxID=184607 RepID=UPI0006863668|nr:M1 family metallopeptidase [Crocinitomix catalasitica]
MKSLFDRIFLFQILAFLLLVSTNNINAQDYFQQKVDFRIQVKLNDKTNFLDGYEEFDYTNNSKTTLNEIYIHLWPNAYKNNKTALAIQLNRDKNDALETASAEELGYIDSLDFKVNDAKVNWSLDAVHIDICKITLNTPLKPGEKITVSTPFKVKIPSGDISRLGFVGQSYQITQWYPKPAVFDNEGWHQMPYLTQGEFYSEFGSFDVEITLPKNYVVGATGDLQTESEIEFLSSKAKETAKKFLEEGFADESSTSSFPPSAEDFKTIRFTQNNVHDFAWFADKRFEVLKGEVVLPNSDRKVDTWAMFVPENYEVWQDAVTYINDALFYYSKWNGDYPYNQATAVDGTISAGGGMEYPNVTVIGETRTEIDLEIVIVHEVGHNWFYGLLGSNERSHAWMDEGLNTLNEMRYIATKYPNNSYLTDMLGGIGPKVHLDSLSHYDMSMLTYKSVAGLGLDQPIELEADDYKSINYGAIVYGKTGLAFTYLKDYLGEEVFDKIMKKYFIDWHFKHPQPADLRAAFEAEVKEDFSWFFDDIIQTTKQIDFKIKSVSLENEKTVVKVSNKGQIAGPCRVDGLKSGKIVATNWIKPNAGELITEFDGVDFDEIIIDKAGVMPDMNSNNNYWRNDKVFNRVEPFSLEFLAGDNEGKNWNANWLPIAGFNAYDKFMIGIALHNITFPKNKLEYTLAPMFSFGQSNIAGLADINYSWVPAKNIRMVTLGVEGKSFGQGLTETQDDARNKVGNYWVVRPYLNFAFGKPYKRKNNLQNIKFLGHIVRENSFERSRDLYGASGLYDLHYKNGRSDFRLDIRFDFYTSTNMLEDIVYTNQVLNSGLTANYKLTYLKEKKKKIGLRFYAGKNLLSRGIQDGRFAFSLGGQSGSQDVTYEHYLFGRNRTSGLFAQQRILNQGGFKTVSNFGTSNDFITALNLTIQLPYIPFLSVYGDIGAFTINNNLELVGDAGLAIEIGDIFGVYFPLYETPNLKTSTATLGNYMRTVRFTLNMNGLNLNEIVPTALL